MEDIERQLLARRYAEDCAAFYGVTDEEQDEIRRQIETAVLAGREPDWNDLAARKGKSMTDADLRARGWAQEEIDRVRSYYL